MSKVQTNGSESGSESRKPKAESRSASKIGQAVDGAVNGLRIEEDTFDHDVDETVRLVASRFGLSMQSVREPQRSRRMQIKARHAVWLALTDMGYKYTRIGEAFGVDHTSVLCAVRRLRMGDETPWKNIKPKGGKKT
jgi:chromosomal replication initiation ATPase DnaA